MAGGPSDPQTFNLYAYAGNSPTNRTDPRGNCFSVSSSSSFEYRTYRLVAAKSILETLGLIWICSYKACDQRTTGPQSYCNTATQYSFLGCHKGFQGLRLGVETKITIRLPYIGTITRTVGECFGITQTNLDFDPCPWVR